MDITARAGVLGGFGNDIINTGAGDQDIRAGRSNDRANAGDGADLIFGQAGNNLLLDEVGGNDALSGGSGADIFIFNDNSDRALVADYESGVDIIAISTGRGHNTRLPRSQFGAT